MQQRTGGFFLCLEQTNLRHFCVINLVELNLVFTTLVQVSQLVKQDVIATGL